MSTLDTHDPARRRGAARRTLRNTLAALALGAVLAACGTVDDSDAATPAGDAALHGFEAESADVQAFSVRDDAAASGGQALEHSGEADAAAELPVTMGAAGAYTVWVRLAGQGEDADALDVDLNGNVTRVFDDAHGRYDWVEVGRATLDPAEDPVVTLGAGEAGVRVDMVALAADEDATADALEARFGSDAGEADTPDGEDEGTAGGDTGGTDGGDEGDEASDDGADAPDGSGVQPARGVVSEPETLAWSEIGEWSLRNESVDGNPYDVRAAVTFTHADGSSREASMYYAGDDRWAFRFPALRTGTWHYRTESEDPELDGHEGTVRVRAASEDASGLMRAQGSKLITATDNGADGRGVINNVYMPSTDDFDNLGELPEDPQARGERIEELLDEAEHNGFPGLMVRVYNSWFSYGDKGYDEHDEETPDAHTFEVLEDLALRAHARGMFVHMWAWGDESRGWTPIGVGGINGEADTRLQRYIGARLGAVPGWTMSYGFDLNEWVEPEEVRRWADTITEHAINAPMLMAREVEDGFDLGDDGLAVNSVDDRPDDGFYALARERLAEGDPVLFERRFLYGRDGVWDQDTTRRALWQFTMAGGAGAIWGPGFEGTEPYPEPEELRLHAHFWEERFDPALQAISDADADPAEEAVTLRAEDGRLTIAYQEATDAMTLDLGGVPPGRSIKAVDTRADAYEEIDVGSLEGDAPTWQAPHESDWVLVVRAD